MIKSKAVDLVLYHAQCRDGFCAAWVANQRWPRAEYRPTAYGTEPPDVMGRKILLVDFCYPRDVMKRLAAGNLVTVLDHHKTAQAALEGLPEELAHMDIPLEVTFDMERSGAGIAWDVLMAEPLSGLCPECAGALHGHTAHDPGCPSRAPWIVRYVEDRDLWRWALSDSREVNAYISSLPYGNPEHFPAWDAAARQPLTKAVEAGRVLLRYIAGYCAAVCENAVTRTIGFYTVPSVNAPQHEISEVLEHLLDLNPSAWFVHGWWQRSDGLFAQSFRSRGDFDVSVIAKELGGGGHKNAAGAQTTGILG